MFRPAQLNFSHLLIALCDVFSRAQLFLHDYLCLVAKIAILSFINHIFSDGFFFIVFDMETHSCLGLLAYQVVLITVDEPLEELVLCLLLQLTLLMIIFPFLA